MKRGQKKEYRYAIKTANADLAAKNNKLKRRNAVLETELDTLKAGHAKLVGLLKKYGRHLNNHKQFCESYKHSDYPCNCGFDEAIVEAEKL